MPVTTTPPRARTARPDKPSTWLRTAGVVGFVVALTWFSAAQVGFTPSELIENFGKAGRLASEFWPPNWEVTDQLVEPYLETISTAIVGSVLGCLWAIPVAFLASRATAPGRLTGMVMRFLMNVLRTMPDLFWALIFTLAVGFNAFAGALALTVFAMVIMAKLFSETIDAMDPGPYEAARASGASWFLTVQKSVMPQVLPEYIAYSLYIFELLIRSAVILGLVGAGGVGENLDRYRQFFVYDNVMVIVLITLVIVLALDYLSAAIRKRLV